MVGKLEGVKSLKHCHETPPISKELVSWHSQEESKVSKPPTFSYKITEYFSYGHVLATNLIKRNWLYWNCSSYEHVTGCKISKVVAHTWPQLYVKNDRAWHSLSRITSLYRQMSSWSTQINYPLRFSTPSYYLCFLFKFGAHKTLSLNWGVRQNNEGITLALLFHPCSG